MKRVRRKNRSGSVSTNKGLGSLDAIRSGLQRFYSEYSRFPTSSEIDKYPYLCSPRYIQKRYGGLRKLREILGLDIVDYGKGKPRVDRWKRISKLSVETEHLVKRFLIETYGEICVHEEKKYGDSRQRMDFFIYGKENFAVDVFNTYVLHHLAVNLNIKIKKYMDYPFRIFFVVTGAEFLQKDIDRLILRKQTKLPPNMRCLTYDEFKKECLLHLLPLNFHIKYSSYYQTRFSFT